MDSYQMIKQAAKAKVLWLCLAAIGISAGVQAAEAPSPQVLAANRLALQDVLQRVLEYNETIQIKMLDAEISQKTLQAERGVFEPQVVGSAERVDTQRPNNTQQSLSFGFLATPVFLERNTLYNAGLEFLAPSGARFRTGYSLRELGNNLQRVRDLEVETFVGTSVVQPLLKNFGPDVTMARIRLAALASDIAFQEYRKQLMLTISQAEAAYWDLYLTQEQEHITAESVATAAKILADNRTRREVGKSSELEVLQAQSGVALRQSRQNEARLKVYEGANRLNAMFSDTTIDTNALPYAVDRPMIKAEPNSMFDHFQQAFNLNPEYLIRQLQVSQENLRLKYTKNQRLPQLDLKGSYGLNGLGGSEGESWDNIDSHEFPAWSVGLEFRLPLSGGVKEKNEYAAARLSKMKVLLSLKEAEVQIANSLDATLQRVRTYLGSVQSYQAVVDFHQKLLDTHLSRLEVGLTDSRTVLETEEKLSEAKLSVIDSLVLYRKALLEMELVKGAALQSRNLDLTKPQLQAKTAAMFAGKDWADQKLVNYQKRILRSLDPKAEANENALNELRLKMLELNHEKLPTP